MRFLLPVLWAIAFAAAFSGRDAETQEAAFGAARGGGVGAGVLHREEFESLADWEDLRFPNIEKGSSYEILRQGGDSVLVVESRGGASGLVWKRSFLVYDYPVLEWRWRVENVLAEGDATRKDGDDYPLRIYVLFDYDPKRLSALQRLKYRTARLFYGEFPPHAAVNYIWANREHGVPFLLNAFSDRSVMFIVDEGETHAGEWRVHSANVLEDYRRAFREDPPRTARLAVMGDADNTGAEIRSYIDYIEVRR